MKSCKSFKKILALLALTLCTPKINAQDIEIPQIPSIETNINLTGNNKRFEAGLIYNVPNLQTNFNLEIEEENFTETINPYFLSYTNPVWKTTHIGFTNNLQLGSDNLENELFTDLGFQHFSHNNLNQIKLSQGFLGIQDRISATIPLGRDSKLTASAGAGGYLTAHHQGILWDNFKTSSALLATIGITENIQLKTGLERSLIKFNPEKYFFTNQSLNLKGLINFNFESDGIALSLFYEPSKTQGRYLDYMNHTAGISLDYLNFGTNIITSLDSIDNFSIKTSVSHNLFEEMFIKGFLEFKNGNFSFGFGLDYGIEKENQTQLPKGLIKDAGYERPTSYKELLENTDNPIKLANIGSHSRYAKINYWPSSPKESFQIGIVDCIEVAWQIDDAGTANNFDIQTSIYSLGEKAHAFSHLQNNGRHFATDNNKSFWMEFNPPENATEEDVTREALIQLSPYLDLSIPENAFVEAYLATPGVAINPETGKQDDVLLREKTFYIQDFKSNSPGYIPIESGLTSKLGPEQFYLSSILERN